MGSKTSSSFPSLLEVYPALNFKKSKTEKSFCLKIVQFLLFGDKNLRQDFFLELYKFIILRFQNDKHVHINPTIAIMCFGQHGVERNESRAGKVFTSR